MEGVTAGFRDTVGPMNGVEGCPTSEFGLGTGVLLTTVGVTVDVDVPRCAGVEVGATVALGMAVGAMVTAAAAATVGDNALSGIPSILGVPPSVTELSSAAAPVFPVPGRATGVDV